MKKQIKTMTIAFMVLATILLTSCGTLVEPN
jgi:predicted small lipoprotein YifL